MAGPLNWSILWLLDVQVPRPARRTYSANRMHRHLKAKAVRRRGIATAAWVAALILPLLSAADERMAPEAARKLTNPLPSTAESVREGRKTYLRLCQYCHGADGRAQANPDFEAPSLRAPSQWQYGTSDGELFVSIRDGAGHEMPPFRKQLEDTQIWQLVLYVRSIGPRDLRPGQDSGGP